MPCLFFFHICKLLIISALILLTLVILFLLFIVINILLLFLQRNKIFMWSCIKKLFGWKSIYPVLLLTLGIILLSLSEFKLWCFSDNYPRINSFLEKIGEIMLVSSLISCLLDSFEFFGIFKKDLQDILFDSKFLKKRKDIQDIWITVSKELFKSKFPSICQPLLNTIKKNYLPENELSYYSDYKMIYDIVFTDESKESIKVKNNISFILKTADEKKIKFPLKNWVCTNEFNKDNVIFEYKEIKVNNVRISPKHIVDEYKDGQILFYYEIELKGRTEYKIEQIIEKTYKLKLDNYIGFKAKWLVNNMDVQVFHPKNMDIIFVERATLDKFNLVNNRADFCEYEYKSLILRNQGYIMILNT